MYQVPNEFMPLTKAQKDLIGRNNSKYIPKSYSQLHASKFNQEILNKRKVKAKRTTFLQKLGRKISKMFSK